MQAVEAMTLLIRECEGQAKTAHELMTNPDYSAETADPEWREAVEQRDVALAVVTAMLNTALPVARFRCFVRIESGKENGREYTICAVNIEDIVAGLYPLAKLARQVYVALWEQRADGADMLEGFQGWTMVPGQGKRLLSFLEGLRKYSVSTLAN